jgi:ACS family allantoate permease-like MFS transporter
MSSRTELEKGSATTAAESPQDAPTPLVDALDADEALGFLTNHPRALQIASEGNAILEDPMQLKKLVRKIDLTIAPLLAAVYFLQFLDKTTLQYTAVMGLREDTHLEGQDYSVVSLLFYLGMFYDLQVMRAWNIDRSRLPGS